MDSSIRNQIAVRTVDVRVPTTNARPIVSHITPGTNDVILDRDSLKIIIARIRSVVIRIPDIVIRLNTGCEAVPLDNDIAKTSKYSGRDAVCLPNDIARDVVVTSWIPRITILSCIGGITDGKCRAGRLDDIHVEIIVQELDIARLESTHHITRKRAAHIISLGETAIHPRILNRVIVPFTRVDISNRVVRRRYVR